MILKIVIALLVWGILWVLRKRHIPKAIFGRSNHAQYGLTQAATFGIFLREEPIWPLITTIVKFKRMNRYEFDQCVRMLTTDGKG